MNHASLFSGIGGFDLAAEWMGWTNLFHVERDEFCRDILRHHFPNTQSYEDIKQFNGYPWAGHVDVLTGGFPCQPFSTAGQRQGVSDDRYLWPEMLRVIREARPTWVVAENVRGLTSWSGGMVFDQVITDLEGEGYQVLPTVLPAASVANCPHKRDRVWIIAYAHGSRNDRAPGQDVGTKPKGRVQEWHEVVFSVESNGLRGLPASADDLGWNRWWSEQRERRAGSGSGDIAHGRPSVSGNTADTYRSLLESGYREREAQGSADSPIRAESPRVPGDWQAFPSQPPLCGGNDGLPTELDGITFSKWRKESVKAYGNAIVPQVAYQIFKSINEHG
jgi:DNA (cytosine-5)-methyltransferase 1